MTSSDVLDFVAAQQRPRAGAGDVARISDAAPDCRRRRSSGAYDSVREAVGWLDQQPVGGLSHVSWWEDDDCYNLDAWESEDAFNSFAQDRLGPGMAKAGVSVEPQVTFRSAHEVFTPKSVKLSS